MDGVYFMIMLIGVAWLCVWTLSEDTARRWRIWWPFDRVGETRAGEDAGAAPDPGIARLPWRRRG